MQFKRCFRKFQLEQATNNLKRSVKHDFWFWFIFSCLDQLNFLFRKIFLFSSGDLFFTFFINGQCKFWKDVNVIIHGKTVTFQIPRPVFTRLEISMVLMEVFQQCFLNGIFSLNSRGKFEWQNRGIVDTPFGIKKFFSYINNPDKFWLKPSSKQLSILVWQNI